MKVVKKKEKKEKKPRKIKEEAIVKNKTPLTKEEIERIRESTLGRIVIKDK